MLQDSCFHLFTLFTRTFSKAIWKLAALFCHHFWYILKHNLFEKIQWGHCQFKPCLHSSQWWQSNSHLSSRSILPETTFEESCVCLECKAEKFSLIPGATGKPTGIERIFFFTPSLHQSLTIILLHFLVCIQLEPWFSWPKKYVVLYHYRIYFFLLCCM